MYIYLSNEQATKDFEIYFDDLKIDHYKVSRVIQSDDYYPFGLTIAGTEYQRIGVKENRYLYNDKELQSDLDLNWYEYGARMYMPDIGRWGVVDPLSEKYRRWSPYNYAVDNPIRFIDPDGNVIVDQNGKIVTYSEKNGWTSNATTDIMRIGNAMMRTETGTKWWNSMNNVSYPISLSVSQRSITKTENNGKKEYIFGDYQNTISTDANGKSEITKAKISIYEGTINEAMKDKPIGDAIITSMLENTLNNDERIASVAGHESVHTTDPENIDKQNNKESKDKIEAKPKSVESQILKETGENHYKLLKPRPLSIY